MKKEFEKPSCRIWKLSHTQWVSLTHTQTAILSRWQFGRRMYHTVHSGANESVSVKSGRLNLCVAAIFHPSNLSIRSSHGRIACAFRLTHTHNTPTETVTVTIFYRLRISKHHSHSSDFIANGRNQKFDHRKTTPNSVNQLLFCVRIFELLVHLNLSTKYDKFVVILIIFRVFWILIAISTAHICNGRSVEKACVMCYCMIRAQWMWSKLQSINRFCCRQPFRLFAWHAQTNHPRIARTVCDFDIIYLKTWIPFYKFTRRFRKKSPTHNWNVSISSISSRCQRIFTLFLPEFLCVSLFMYAVFRRPLLCL